MNPIFLLLSLLGATAAAARSSNSSSDGPDPLSAMGLGVANDDDEEENNTTTNAVVVGTTADDYDAVTAPPADTETDETDEEDDAEDEDPSVELEDEQDTNDDGTPVVPAGFEMIFDDLVVADDEPAEQDGSAADDEEDEPEAAPAPVEDEEEVVDEPVEEETVAEATEDGAEENGVEEPANDPEEEVVEDSVDDEGVVVVEEPAAPEEEESEPNEDGATTGTSQATAPTPTSDGPLVLESFASDAFSDDLDAPLVFQFSEDIQLGDGGIELRVYDTNGYETVERIDSSNLQVSGNQLSVSPSGGLDPLRDYTLNIEAGAVETLDGEPYAGLTNDTFAFSSGIGIEEPTIDFSQYDTIIDGATFDETLFLDTGDSNTLIINSTFENIDGSGIMLRNVENVTIANSTFRNIDDFGILLRSSGSSDGVTITGNTFEDIGGDAIHAAKRFADDVDHTNLIVHDNDLHDVATDGFFYHGIYVQSSEAVVWGNELTGTVGGNGISIRGDGIVYDNYVDVTSGREYGSGIKYFSDHMSGDSSTLIIADNVVEGNNLHSGIELDQTSSNQPSNIADEDWVVNDFIFLRNEVDGRNDYLIDSRLEDASWSTIDFIEDAPETSNTLSATLLPEVPVEDTSFDETESDAELELMF